LELRGLGQCLPGGEEPLVQVVEGPLPLEPLDPDHHLGVRVLVLDRRQRLLAEDVVGGHDDRRDQEEDDEGTPRPRELRRFGVVPLAEPQDVPEEQSLHHDHHGRGQDGDDLVEAANLLGLLRGRYFRAGHQAQQDQRSRREERTVPPGRTRHPYPVTVNWKTMPIEAWGGLFSNRKVWMPDVMVVGIPWYLNFWTKIVVADVVEPDRFLAHAVDMSANTARIASTRHATCVPRELLTGIATSSARTGSCHAGR